MPQRLTELAWRMLVERCELVSKRRRIFMSQDKRRDWREICEQVLREKDAGRVNALLEELLDVLEERERTRSQRPSSPHSS